MTENRFWKYGNLWRNGGDREHENTEFDLCGGNSTNKSSTMADAKKKKPPEDAPEIKMVKSIPGRLLSK